MFPEEDTEASGVSDAGEKNTTTSSSPPASVTLSVLSLEQETHPPSVAPPAKFSLQITEGISCHFFHSFIYSVGKNLSEKSETDLE